MERTRYALLAEQLVEGQREPGQERRCERVARAELERDDS